MIAHPELALLSRADPVWVARLKITIPRHLIVTKMYSKVVHWVSMPLMGREKAATFKVRPKTQKPSTSHTKKTPSILSMQIKVIVL